MGTLRSTFSYLAIVGFALALAVHVLALIGIPVQDRLPMVWLLHIGVFVVFIPALIYQRGRTKSKNLTLAIREVPTWILVSLVVLFLYTGFNFILALSMLEAGSPEIRDGTYVLQRKGQILRELTEDEYRSALATQLRLFSGHWLFFFAASVVALQLSKGPDEV